MKRIIAFLTSIILLAVTLSLMGIFYTSKIHKSYRDNIGEILSSCKYKSIVLKKEAIRKGDNLFLVGSSELNTSKYPSHPIHIFKKSLSGFQVNLIGRAGCTTLIHAIDAGALGKALKNQKIAFIVSPQWFTRYGASEDTFEANASEYEIYRFLFNRGVPRSEKRILCKRIMKICHEYESQDFVILRRYCKLYLSNGFFPRTAYYILKPYYMLRYSVLSIKDLVNSYKVIMKKTQKTHYEKMNYSMDDWNTKMDEAINYSESKCHNKYFVEDKFLKNKRIKAKLKKTKFKRTDYNVSIEYTDFNMLLRLYKRFQVKPLFIILPVHGQLYDYCGYPRYKRMIFYKRINKIIKSYGFKVSDFSNHEYDKYFLKDISHLGGKGWIYIDKAIYDFYKKN